MPELDDLYAFVDAHHVAHLATAGEGGPHAAPVFYVRQGSGIVWTSAPHVLHSRHLIADAACALSIAPSAPSMRHVQGVQMRGSAAVGDQQALGEAFFARFPAARAVTRPDHRFWLFTPVWARLVDVEAGVTRTREWRLPEGR